MAKFDFQHLDTSQPLIDPETGLATPYFARFLYNQLENGEGIDEDVTTLAASIAGKAEKSLVLTAGTGLSGGGDLSADRSFALNAGIDLLTDVDTSTTPPVDGQALIWATSEWIPGDVAASGGGGGATIGTKVSRVGAQSVAVNTTVPVQFDTELLDELGAWNPAQPTRFTIVEAGWFACIGSVKWAANTGLGRQIWWRRYNSAGVAQEIVGRHSQPGDSIHNDPFMAASAVVKCDAGDYLELQVLTNNATINITDCYANVARMSATVPEYLGTRRLVAASQALPAITDTVIVTGTEEYNDGGWNYAAGVIDIPSGVTKIDLSGYFAVGSATGQAVIKLQLAPDGVTWGDVAVHDTDTAGAEFVAASALGIPVTGGTSKVRMLGYVDTARSVTSGNLAVRAAASAAAAPSPIFLSEVLTEAGTAANLEAADVGSYKRWTNAGAKTLTIRTQATHALPANGDWHIRNTGGTLTIAPAGGVTVTPPNGGSLVIPTEGTVTLKRVAADTFDLMGQTV